MLQTSLNIQIDPTLSTFKAWMTEQAVEEPLFVLMDTNTHQHCLPAIKSIIGNAHQLIPIIINPGEEHKTLQTAEEIIKMLAQHQAGKKNVLISLGGGVVCDIGAFVADIYKRGMRSVLIPTTILAQLDASIGGKTGVDFLGNKNMVGTFSLPEQIFISSRFIETLPQKEKMNGVAEAFKHAFIADANYWELIKQDPLKNIDALIATSISIKKVIVEKDPLEKGIRKILNAGHTVGHAIESTFVNHAIHIGHGEAVVSGLIIELYLSNQAGFISSDQMNEGVKYLNKHYTKLPLDRFSIDEYLGYMYQDKKNSGKKISFSLITKIGEANWDQYLEKSLIRSGFNFYMKA